MQGRLPTDNAAIDRALEVALLECLRSLQKTNPSLFLTAKQLKKAERDSRFLPASAAALASIVCRSTNDTFQWSMIETISKWYRPQDDENDISENETTDQNEIASTSKDNDSDSRSDNQAARIDEFGGGEIGSKDNNTQPRNDNEDSIADAEDDEDRDASSNEGDHDTVANSEEETVQLIREVGEIIEDRFRQILAVHDDSAAKSKSKSKRNKKEKTTEVCEEEVQGEDIDQDDDMSQRSSDSLKSYDFSVASGDHHQQSQATAHGRLSPDEIEFDDQDVISEGSNKETQPVEEDQNHQSAFDEDDSWW